MIMSLYIHLIGEADMPSQSEINEMQKLLFNDIDKEDGLDKAFETMQALRGEWWMLNMENDANIEQ